MDVNISLFEELFSLGMMPLPIKWDLLNRQASAHPEHDTKIVNINIEYVRGLMSNGFRGANGMALKLFPPFGMYDIDVKNSTNPNLFHEWLSAVNAKNDTVLNKCCIEKTRSEGYHVYIKYTKLDHKIPCAREGGKEVISVYTGGLLSYCSPTPHYEIVSGSLTDLEELTDDEFQLLLNTSSEFNTDTDFIPGENPVRIIEYPMEYEVMCMQFDRECDDHMFNAILNSIGLYEVKPDNPHKFKAKNGKPQYRPYLREGSVGDYSAKAYFYEQKSLMIFSASMSKFPTFHDADRQNDKRWVLSPAKILYYKNDKSWPDAIQEMKLICESSGIELVQTKPITEKHILQYDRCRFPYDILPDRILNYIQAQSVQHEYLANYIIAAAAGVIGNSAHLMAQPGYWVKPILYMAVVAAPGATKTPSLNKALAPIRTFEAELFEAYSKEQQRYKSELAAYKKDKKNHNEPEPPVYKQVTIEDATIEMLIKILTENPEGCVLVADELVGFMNRMNQYKEGDELQKWLQMWSGSPILLQRLSREVNRVSEPAVTIIGGIQPGVLAGLSKAENEHNGFYHRFLFVYPEQAKKRPWDTNFTINEYVVTDFNMVFRELLFHRRKERINYRLSDEANLMYMEWFNNKNLYYDKANNDNIKGIIAKYQEYCLRFALVLQVLHDAYDRGAVVEGVNMERAIRLTEYYLGNMNKSLKILAPETPAESLQKPYNLLFADLPELFTMKTAVLIGDNHKIKPSTVKMFVQRNLNKLFRLISRGEYEKIF